MPVGKITGYLVKITGNGLEDEHIAARKIIELTQVIVFVVEKYIFRKWDYGIGIALYKVKVKTQPAGGQVERRGGGEKKMRYEVYATAFHGGRMAAIEWENRKSLLGGRLLQHLKAWDITTLEKFKAVRGIQQKKDGGDACFDCRKIAKIIRLES